MAKALGIKKARQVIRLDDDPDSPSFVLDLSDKNVVDKGKAVYADFLRNKEAFDRLEGSDTISDEDATALAGFWERTITTLLGGQAFIEIKNYVTDGADIPTKDILLLLTPVVLYLLEQVQAVVTANSNEAVLSYARSHSAASHAI